MSSQSGARARGVGLATILILGSGLAACSGSDDDGSNGADPTGESSASQGPSGSASATSTATTSAPATSSPAPSRPASVPPTATQTPRVGISTAPPVTAGAPAVLGGAEVEVRVTSTRPVTVTADVPGEIAGPALAVEISVTNGSDDPFSLDGMAVNASFDDARPGEQTSASPSKPMTGSLAPGDTADGTYVFVLPRGASAAGAVIEVSSDESPIVVQIES